MNDNDNGNKKITITKFLQNIIGGIASLSNDDVLVYTPSLALRLYFNPDGTLSQEATGTQASFTLSFMYRPEDINKIQQDLNSEIEPKKYLHVADMEFLVPTDSVATKKQIFKSLATDSSD